MSFHYIDHRLFSDATRLYLNVTEGFNEADAYMIELPDYNDMVHYAEHIPKQTQLMSLIVPSIDEDDPDTEEVLVITVPVYDGDLRATKELLEDILTNRIAHYNCGDEFPSIDAARCFLKEFYIEVNGNKSYYKQLPPF